MGSSCDIYYRGLEVVNDYGYGGAWYHDGLVEGVGGERGGIWIRLSSWE